MPTSAQLPRGARSLGQPGGALAAHALEMGAVEAGAKEIGVVEPGVLQLGAGEVGVREIGAREVGAGEISLGEHGAAEFGALEIGRQIAMLVADLAERPELCAAEIGLVEMRTLEDCAAQIG